MITNEFWLDRWQSGRIGFHQEGVNAWLMEYWPSLPKGSHVLVPLCGKSNDMIWLAEQGYRVTGVELSSLAVVQFLGDNDLTYETQQEGDLKIHTVAEVPLRIIEGDYFFFKEQGFDACYDRAAMIAMSEVRRAEYVEHTKSLLSPSAAVLLISTKHAGEEEGPPFSVEDDSVIQMWGEAIQKVASEDLVQSNPQYKDRGYSFFEESVWHIVPKQI